MGLFDGLFKNNNNGMDAAAAGLGSSFADSNRMVLQVGMLLMGLFLFLIVLRMGVSLTVWFSKPSNAPHLIDGMIQGNETRIFQQDAAGSQQIHRSVNEDEGIEFSWSVWLFVQNSNFGSSSSSSSSGDKSTKQRLKHVFSKGSAALGADGRADYSNGPGVYISTDRNELVVVMDTFQTIGDEIKIPNLPLNKWFHLLIRCKDSTIDLYMNGTLARSVDLMSVPRQNFGNVYVGLNNGFDGYLSNLWYYNYALGTTQLQQLVSAGPNTRMVGGIDSSLFANDYLSLRWFFDGSSSLFNPTPPSTAASPVASAAAAPTTSSTPTTTTSTPPP